MKAGPPPHWREFPSAVAALQRALARLSVPSAVIGGVAVIAHGVARFTEDVDATVAAADLDLQQLMRLFKQEKIVPRIPDWAQLVEAAQVLLLVHRPTGIGIDVSMAWLPFEEEALRQARPLRFAGVILRVVRPEDLIIYKLIAHRPQDLWDAERLAVFHQSTIDFGRVRRVLGQLSEHLDGPNRLDSLDELGGRLSPPAAARSPQAPSLRARRRKAPRPATEPLPTSGKAAETKANARPRGKRSPTGRAADPGAHAQAVET